ncbi:MarR family winged helix-turn-helix transcriptional regulator [Pacificimonas sp. ICDLI1SI03]
MRITNPKLTQWGVDLTESRLMVALLEKGELSAGEVVELMALPQSTVSHQLRRLERLGYITRQPSKKDQRRIIAKLTDEGRKVAQECNEHSGRVTEDLYFAIGADQMEMVREALKRVDAELASK